jgi:hypothetical protein
MRKRDIIRSKLSTPPLSVRHVSIAVLEAWADGTVEESHVMRQIAKCHGKETCSRCLESVEYYRHKRDASAGASAGSTGVAGSPN